MRPVSTGFLASLTGAHTLAVRANIASHAGPAVAGTPVDVVSGQVTLDSTADVRGSLDMVVKGTWPTAAVVAAGGVTTGTATSVHPYGVQLQVARGIVFGNGSVEVAKLGVFAVQSVEQDGLRATPEIHITGMDRSALLIEAGVDAAQLFPAATTWGGFVGGLLTQVHSQLTYHLDFPGTTPLGRDLLLEEGTGNNRWKLIADSAAALGKMAYFDQDGILQIRDLPDPGTPVWTVAAGRGGVMVSSGRKLTRDGQANGVLALGEAVTDQPPAQGLAYDTGSASLTKWGDAFGRRLRIFASPLLTSDSMAAAAAQTVLQRTVGLPYSLDLSAVPNPALEPWDVLAVQHSPSDVETHVLDRVSVPLSASGAVTLDTRETSTVLVTTV
jgi:hypothetical protein